MDLLALKSLMIEKVTDCDGNERKKFYQHHIHPLSETLKHQRMFSQLHALQISVQANKNRYNKQPVSTESSWLG
jgi:hypothetical protein